MDDSKDFSTDAGANGPKRRRRRLGEVGGEDSRPPLNPNTGGAKSGRTIWWRLRLPGFVTSWGLAPHFRLFLFLGGTLISVAILLYNESIIQELKEHERIRVHMHAYLFSSLPMVTDQMAEFIFREVINNPRSDFAIIFTDYKGRITDRKGDDLPAVQDTSQVASQVLEETLAAMDARNEPIPYYLESAVVGQIYFKDGNAVITNLKGDVATWGGKDLPAVDDTTQAALDQIVARLGQAAAFDPPTIFKVPIDSFSYLYFNEISFVITDNGDEVVVWDGHGLPDAADTTEAAKGQVKRLSQTMESQPFKIQAAQYIHYGDSSLIGRVSFALSLLFGTIVLFVLVGYMGFRNIRRSEQRSIWVGMAKETAHQLGTPLSSLSGWLELINGEIETAMRQGDDERVQRIGRMAGEMQKDMGRLTQIASRFSQVGSTPELKLGDVRGVLTETVNYFKGRGPQFGRHEIRVDLAEVPLVPLNTELIGWAFENLFKNAIDAIGRQAGIIDIHVLPLPDHDALQITFQDNGCGIAPEHLSRIFQPGYSTKKRGWGLGLSFVKRIIEEYHKGRINVAQTGPGEGTTFEIILPTARATT